MVKNKKANIIYSSFITKKLNFSFERLNEQLGFDQPLPQACRQLIQYSHERRFKQNLRREKNRKNIVTSKQHFNINVNSSVSIKTKSYFVLSILQFIISTLSQLACSGMRSKSITINCKKFFQMIFLICIYSNLNINFL